MPKWRIRCRCPSFAPGWMTQPEFAAYVARDVTQIGGAVRAMGIRAE